MFTQTITKTYNFETATIEIGIMLVVSFILGYLFRHFSSPKKSTSHSSEWIDLQLQNKVLNEKLNSMSIEKDALKKSIIIEYSSKIDKLKSKLSNTRTDLEKCLSSKADNIQTNPKPKKVLKAK